jgi:hypothetical protein
MTGPRKLRGRIYRIPGFKGLSYAENGKLWRRWYFGLYLRMR